MCSRKEELSPSLSTGAGVWIPVQSEYFHNNNCLPLHPQQTADVKFLMLLDNYNHKETHPTPFCSPLSHPPQVDDSCIANHLHERRVKAEDELSMVREWLLVS